MSYTKLFSSIITSTIWSEDDQTRIVWITMLAVSDKNGEVQASVPGLARLAGVPVEDCRAALLKFLSPDADSRTKDDEGRRIEEIDGGWILLNHRKYRDMANDDDRRRKAAERQQRSRARKSRNSHACVTLESRQKSQADADADVLLEKEPKGAEAPLLPPVVEPQSRRMPDEEPAKPGSRPTGRAALRAEAEATNLLPLPPGLNSPEFRAVWGEWCQHRARLAGQGKPWSAIAARNLLRQCCDNGEAWAIAEIRQALASGWQGVQWDQRRNPSDVRSQPLKPNGNNPQGAPRPAPIVTRNTAPLPSGRQSLNALAWKPAPRVQDDGRSGA